MRLVLTGEGLEQVSGCSRTRGHPGHQQRCGWGRRSCSDAEQLLRAQWAPGLSHPTGRPREVVTPSLHHPVTPSPCLREAARGRLPGYAAAGCRGSQAGLPMCPQPHAGLPASWKTRAALSMIPSLGQRTLKQPHGKQPVEIWSWPLLLMSPHSSLCINI